MKVFLVFCKFSFDCAEFSLKILDWFLFLKIMPDHGIVWSISEDTSVSLVLFNLRNRVNYMVDRFPEGFADFNPDAIGNFLNQVRAIEEAVAKIYEWYNDLNRSVD